MRGGLHDLQPLSLCRGRWQLMWLSIPYLYCLFYFLFFRWFFWRCPGSFVLSGVWENIFSPLSKYFLKGTYCTKLFFAQVTFSADETIKAKLLYKRNEANYVVCIQAYHTDNGVLTSKYFIDV